MTNLKMMEAYTTVKKGEDRDKIISKMKKKMVKLLLETESVWKIHRVKSLDDTVRITISVKEDTDDPQL